MAGGWGRVARRPQFFGHHQELRELRRLIIMNFIIGLLTVILVLDCLFLLLLILIQLPKKEAGAGVAFGGGATDALFGARSRTPPTKITQNSPARFPRFSLFLSGMRAQQAHASGRQFAE